MAISKKKLTEILEYLDMFGTKPGFYAERKAKFYTVSGGLFTVISLCLSLFVFFIFSLDDLRYLSPQITTSLISTNYYKKIKFGVEKIWIPVRIADYYSQFVNPEGLVYPIFQYCHAERHNSSVPLKTTGKILKYKLCNETSMVNRPDIYDIKIPLNELYCIDMENLEMGGDHNSDFIGYVKADFYYCQNGDYYNETNPNCTDYEKIKKRIGEKNSLVFELYYPEVQFQPSNYDIPVKVIYKAHTYRFSKFSNKLERLILREHKLSDDKGFFNKAIKNTSYWGVSTLEGHYYSTQLGDITLQSSTSKLYSFYIYLEPTIKLYERKYKKCFAIVAEGLPLMFVVFTIFENIAKIFKLTEENKTMIELLFENLKEKPNKFEKHLNEIKSKKEKEICPSLFNVGMERVKSYSKDNSRSEFRNTLNINQKKLGLDKRIQTNSKNINVSNLNNLISSSSNNNNNLNFIKNKQEQEMSSNILMLKQNNIFNRRNSQSLLSNCNSYFNSPKIKYVTGKLFPYSFYFFSACVKSPNIKKNNFFFSEKFTKVYNFLTQILDISTYLILQREFNILKNSFLDDKKKLAFIEQNNKINVNDRLFMRKINHCLASQNFHIFSQNKIKK